MGLYAGEAEFAKGKPKLGTFRRTSLDGKTISHYELMKENLKGKQFLPLGTLLTPEEAKFLSLEGRRALREHVAGVQFLRRNTGTGRGCSSATLRSTTRA